MMSRRNVIGAAAAAGGAAILSKSGLIAPVARAAEAQEDTASTEPSSRPAEPGKDYMPVHTPNGATLEHRVVDGVKVMHLVAEEIEHEFAPGLRAKCLGYNGRTPGPTIAHIGAALDPRLGEAAQATIAACPNYRWLGALPHGTARRFIARARALVHPSRMEGGANVVVEAIRSGVPVLASRIDGNVGLLGADYDGYFPVGDAAALASLARRFCAEPAFAARLRTQCALREPPCRPAAERTAVRALVASLLPARQRAR